MKPVADVTF